MIETLKRIAVALPVQTLVRVDHLAAVLEGLRLQGRIGQPKASARQTRVATIRALVECGLRNYEDEQQQLHRQQSADPTTVADAKSLVAEFGGDGLKPIIAAPIFDHPEVLAFFGRVAQGLRDARTKGVLS